jgi:hypothetical protein
MLAGSVTGHDFSRADEAAEKWRALAPAPIQSTDWAYDPLEMHLTKLRISELAKETCNGA